MFVLLWNIIVKFSLHVDLLYNILHLYCANVSPSVQDWLLGNKQYPILLFSRIAKMLIKEAENLQEMNHKFIVSYYGMFLDEEAHRYGLVMEFVHHGSLDHLLERVLLK